jgi:hypothetical protein
MRRDSHRSRAAPRCAEYTNRGLPGHEHTAQQPVNRGKLGISRVQNCDPQVLPRYSRQNRYLAESSSGVMRT